MKHIQSLLSFFLSLLLVTVQVAQLQAFSVGGNTAAANTRTAAANTRTAATRNVNVAALKETANADRDLGPTSVSASASTSTPTEHELELELELEFPTEQQVIEAAQRFMQNAGYFNPMDDSLFANDFIFRGPVIGPLNLDDYKEVLDYFSIYEAFPDINPNCFGYSVDPDDPFRVWFQLRATGTYTNPLGGPLGYVIQPDGQKYRGSTETWSLTFTFDDENETLNENKRQNKTLKARLLTAGYVSDRFEDKSTTDGFGLSFGILKTLGLSIPSGVGSPILQFIQAANDPLVGLGITPKAMSREEELPKWWKNEKRGAEL